MTQPCGLVDWRNELSEPPNSPQNLTILGVTSRTARIAWSISTAKPKIERFVVQWKAQYGNMSCSFTRDTTIGIQRVGGLLLNWIQYTELQNFQTFILATKSSLSPQDHWPELSPQTAGRSRPRRRRCTGRWRRPASPPSDRPRSTRSGSSLRTSWGAARRGECCR